MLSTVADAIGLDPAELENHFGSTTLQRGAGYARAKRVLSLAWDEHEQMLAASVVGQGALYKTRAFFDDTGDGLEFSEGHCSCPIGRNCKHVAAVVLAATTQDLAPTAPPRPTAVPHLSSWERPLRELAAARPAPSTGSPLAIELRLTPERYSSSGVPRLMARLMRPAVRGGWVNGSLDWSGLESWSVREAGYREDHVALIRKIHHACQAAQPYGGYMFGYRPDRSLDLSACESPALWALLDQAARLGLPLLHATAALGELAPPVNGEVVLDVTRDADDGLVVRARLQIDGAPAPELMPVRFIGRDAHGIVCAPRADVEAGHGLERWRLVLVALARPAVAQLERMLLCDERTVVPAAAIDRFAQDLCPALRHIAPLVSSDGSFTPPVVSEPELVLVARHQPGPLLTLGWEWEYTMGDARLRAPFGVQDDFAGYRDEQAEQERAQAVALDEPALIAAGLVDARGRPRATASVTVAGLDGLGVSTEVLPRVDAHPGMRLEIEGEAPDYRDVGESLSVGVSTSDITGERDWFDLGVTITVGDRELAFAAVFAALARGETRMLLDDGAHFSLQDPRLQSLRALIQEARALVDTPSAGLRISRYQTSLWSELTAVGVVTEQAERWERAVQRLESLEEFAVPEQPTGLHAQMRPYQNEGFAWLAALWDLELGGILADDMGLGKTLQALALICHARERDPATGPFLVVTPTSVASNWANEAARFAPGLRVEVMLDTLAKSGRGLAEIAQADVVVTTYTLFRLDAHAHRKVPWAGLILDEAQFVKNHRGKTYRCACELPVPFTLAITGTPMENNLMELWALLSLTSPGLFPDPQRFVEYYARPIERRGADDRLDLLRRRIRPLIKRRTKELVASELPPKQEQTLAIELHPRHRKLYDTHLQRERQRVLALLDDFEHNRITILRSITRLRQLSLHPALVDEHHAAIPCTKLDTLAEQLEDIVASGHRALVFSQFTGFLGRVRERLHSEGIGHCYLDGSTRRRDTVITRFRAGDDPVFLISLKAGGVGLNLTEADYCFLLDPWWNPATEAQAIDRTHRIGQTRQVMVYRLIAQATIEEKVRALAQRKAELFTGVMDDGDLFAGAISAEDIRGLLS